MLLLEHSPFPPPPPTGPADHSNYVDAPAQEQIGQQDMGLCAFPAACPPRAHLEQAGFGAHKTSPGKRPWPQHVATPRAGHTARCQVGFDLGRVVLYYEHEMPSGITQRAPSYSGKRQRGSPCANKDVLTLSCRQRHRKHAATPAAYWPPMSLKPLCVLSD